MFSTVSQLLTYIKQPSEVLPIEVSFGSLSVLPKGALEIVDVSATAKRWKRKFPDDEEDASDFVLGDPEIVLPQKTTVRAVVHGGESGYDYQVSLLVTFDNGSVLEEEVFVRVREN